MPYEKDLKNHEDYYSNFFFIAIRAGELKKAEEAVNYIIASATSGSKRREYNYQKAFLYYQTRRYNEAIKILNPLIASHRSHSRKIKTQDYDDLTWLRAWCYYLDKDALRAREALMQNQQWTRDRARNLYWLAQAEWGLDNRMEAVAYFKQLARPVIEGKFFSYYNYLAWLRYESYKEFTTSELLRSHLSNLKSGRGFYVVPDGSARSQAILENYDAFYGDVGATDEGSIQIVNQEEVSEDEKKTAGLSIYTSKELKNEMSWADDLIRWGYRDLAKWHLFEIEKTLTGSRYANKSESSPLIRYYLENQYYNRSLTLANSVTPPAGRKLNLQEEPLVWTALYPQAYKKSVESEAEKRKLTPFLLWSIMKAETQYKYDAISPVGAVGLMQFMPYTSQKVAVMLKDDKHRVGDLFEPDLAVRYGAMYLRKLSDELGGQYPLIAAAYNGGPHRVKLWLRNFREKDGTNAEFDIFIEHIPFNETRAYVKRVMSYMLTYRRLYENEVNFAGNRWLIEKNPYKLQDPIVLKEEWPFEREVASKEETVPGPIPGRNESTNVSQPGIGPGTED